MSTLSLSMLGQRLQDMVEKNSGALDTRLQGTGANAVRQPELTMPYEKELRAARAQETESTWDILKSPETLIKLGLAAAGGLSGNANLQMAGLGLATGALSGADADASQQRADKLDRIANLEKLAADYRTELIKLAGDRPEMFQDPTGGNLFTAEERVGMFGVPLNPAGDYIQETMTAQRKARIQFLTGTATKLALEGREQAVVALGPYLNDALDIDFPAETWATLAKIAQDPQGTVDEQVQKFITPLTSSATLDSINNMVTAFLEDDNPNAQIADHMHLLVSKKKIEDALSPAERDEVNSAVGLALVQKHLDEMDEESRSYWTQPENAPELYKTVLAGRSQAVYQAVVKRHPNLESVDWDTELVQMAGAAVAESAAFKPMLQALSGTPEEQLNSATEAMVSALQTALVSRRKDAVHQAAVAELEIIRQRVNATNAQQTETK